jgi:hypothetical protein
MAPGLETRGFLFGVEAYGLSFWISGNYGILRTFQQIAALRPGDVVKGGYAPLACQPITLT